MAYLPVSHPDQTLLLPPSLGELIGEKELCRVVSAFVDALPASALEGKFPHDAGAPSYHPRLMLKVILYAYTQRLYSCRSMARALGRDVHFMWLASMERPCHNSLNRFRGDYLREVLPEAFAALSQMLLEHGYIRQEDYFVDGTIVRADANKHSHVWRKNTERFKARVGERARQIIEEAEKLNAAEQHEPEQASAIAPCEIVQAAGSLAREKQKSAPRHEPMSASQIEQAAGEYLRSPERSARKTGKALEKEAAKMRKYEEQEKTLAGRNSYSKTDPDATFMRTKEGQLAAGYNVQSGTQDGFITGISVGQNANDAACFIAHMEQRKALGLAAPSRAMADSVYGSEENYAYLEGEGVESYLKYPCFHRETTGHLKPYEKASFAFDEERNVFVCPRGHNLLMIGENKQTLTGSGYVKSENIYECKECERCRVRGQCTKGQGNRRIRHSIALGRYQRAARDRLQSEQGIALRERRGHECETPFAQIKHNMGIGRFHLRGLAKVTSESFLIALAHNFRRLLGRIESENKPWKPGEKEQKTARQSSKIARDAPARLLRAFFGKIVRLKRSGQKETLIWN